jgi:hypothetical protein
MAGCGLRKGFYGVSGLSVNKWYQREANIERNFVQKLAIPCLKLSVAGQAGWPDRCVLMPGGKPLIIEFKRPGEKLKPIQEMRRETLKDLGYEIETFTSTKEALDAVQSHYKAWLATRGPSRRVGPGQRPKKGC